MEGMNAPDLHYVIPGWNENRWSDLLASLIKTDPGPIQQLIGVRTDDVQREVTIPGSKPRTSDRLDLLLTQNGRQVAAIEVKVLSDLGVDQLTRYRAAFPHLDAYCVLHLAGLPVSLGDDQWQMLTWESVLGAYGASRHPWVATTARAWLDQLNSLVPRVDADTVWNDVADDPAGLELALRARIAWLARQISSSRLGTDVVQSSGGGLWVLRIWTVTQISNLRVQVEVQEGLSATEWGFDPLRRYCDRIRGPAPLVGLRLSDVDTSESFDWGLLRDVFAEHVLDDRGVPKAGFSWQLTPASPRHPVDRAAWRDMVESGGPKWLGKGFGMAVAKQKYRECLFGARLQYLPTMTLGEIRDELARLEPLMEAMAHSVSPKSVK